MKKLVSIFFLVLTAFVITACGSSGEDSGSSDSGSDSSSSDKLVVVDWGGAVTDARMDTIFKPFEEEFGVEVVVESPTDYGKLKAMVDGGNVTWDVVNVDTFWSIQAGEQGLLEEMDYDIIEGEGVIDELLLDYAVGAELYSTVIAYNTDQIAEGEEPQNWQDFWDVEKYPGPRGLFNSPMETLEIALLADGVAPEDLYPLDVERAFKSLEKLEEATEVIWWDAGAQPVELLTSGSATLSAAWNGRITEAKKDGAPVDLQYQQATLSSESWAVPKGSKNKDLAMQFINFATSKEIQAAFSETIDYSPANAAAVELLDPEVQDRLGQSPKLAETQVLINTEFWAENYEEINRQFQEWQLK